MTTLTTTYKKYSNELPREFGNITSDEVETEDPLDSSVKSLDEYMEEQDFDPEEDKGYYDEDEGLFPSLWDKR